MDILVQGRLKGPRYATQVRHYCLLIDSSLWSGTRHAQVVVHPTNKAIGSYGKRSQFPDHGSPKKKDIGSNCKRDPENPDLQELCDADAGPPGVKIISNPHGGSWNVGLLEGFNQGQGNGVNLDSLPQVTKGE